MIRGLWWLLLNIPVLVWRFVKPIYCIIGPWHRWNQSQYWRDPGPGSQFFYKKCERCDFEYPEHMSNHHAYERYFRPMSDNRPVDRNPYK